MDFMKSIEDVFGVFAVGIFTLLSIYTMYGVAFCKIQSIKEFYKNMLPTTSNENSTGNSNPPAPTKIPLYPGVFIAAAAIFIFGFGLIIQDTADKYTDSSVCGKKDSENIVVRLNNRFDILKNESDLRFNALIKEENENFKLNSLGISVFRLADFLLYPNHNFSENQKNFLNHVSKSPRAPIPKEIEKDEIKGVTSTVYYRSKNWAFSQATYYDELSSLQIRVDFSRSILLISVLTMVGLVAAFLISIVPMIRKTIKKDTSFKAKRHLVNIIFLLVLLFIICCLSRTGYDNSERNFNERVMGYYTSFLDNYPLYHPGKELFKEETVEKKEKGTTREATYNFPTER